MKTCCLTVFTVKEDNIPVFWSALVDAIRSGSSLLTKELITGSASLQYDGTGETLDAAIQAAVEASGTDIELVCGQLAHDMSLELYGLACA